MSASTGVGEPEDRRAEQGLVEPSSVEQSQVDQAHEPLVGQQWQQQNRKSGRPEPKAEAQPHIQARPQQPPPPSPTQPPSPSQGSQPQPPPPDPKQVARRVSKSNTQGSSKRPGDPAGRGDKRSKDVRDRALAREARWQNNRLAVPYRTDGPKVSLGVLWFLMLTGAVLLASFNDNRTLASIVIVAIAAPVAGLAGLQTGNAWFPNVTATRAWTALAAYLAAVAGVLGPVGVLLGVTVALIILAVYVMLYRGHNRPPLQLFDVLARSSLPVGIAVASLAALGRIELGALASLILLVSAYEVGDFLVGSGSSNAIEGPLAGVVSLGAVAFFLFLVLPAPFTRTSILLFSALAGVCCTLGQIAASGLLPRGGEWAPALRRLDSYIVVAPIWLVLLQQVPQLSS